MRKLKLMADYGCFPLWEASAHLVGNVDPESLPISGELKQELGDWAAVYDSTLKQTDPANSGFETLAEDDAFDERGANLAKRLQVELGYEFGIIFKGFPGSHTKKH
jgi:hypothetical protein